jgi:molecular chaperone HtpG
VGKGICSITYIALIYRNLTTASTCHFVASFLRGISFERLFNTNNINFIFALMQKGTIAVQTENIFPIIKKFLYSDHEIFLRELVANATDATTKLKVLAQSGEVNGEIGDTNIEILLDQDAKTLTIRDRGIGMTEEEVLRYLNQIAFSSASEFLEKHKDSGIIGHFGLGFYSAFMVADKVEVHTRSYKTDSQAVSWSCDGSPNYELDFIDKPERGTDIILHIADDSAEFLEQHRIQTLLDKYCKYLPILIQFGTKTDYVPNEDEASEEKETAVEVPNFINNTHPLWKKNPNELTDEDYRNFYRELYPFAAEPMFWIHLNIDYPFNLTGVLYFPKLGNAMEVSRNKIHLYCNQVFVTDDVRNIVPEWLQLLHGVIDSPDIPLNVSRSYLQSDANVKKISDYITKKVADKLNDLFKQDRPAFEQKWVDLGVFVKYGMVSDEKFNDRAQNFALLANTTNKYFLLNEYTDTIKDTQTDKHNKVVCIYTNDPEGQDALIQGAQKRGYDVLKMDTVLDNHWMQHLEYKDKQGFVFVRVDSDTLDNLVQKDEQQTSILSETEVAKIKTYFEAVLSEKPGTQVSCKPLSTDEAPVSLIKPEFMRRMKEMQMMQGGNDMFPDMYNVVVNTNHPAIAQKLNTASEADQPAIAQYLYDLALLQQGMLKGAALTKFVERSLSSL